MYRTTEVHVDGWVDRLTIAAVVTGLAKGLPALIEILNV
jgi:hypothetical protein